MLLLAAIAACDTQGQEGGRCKSGGILGPVHCDDGLVCNTALEPYTKAASGGAQPLRFCHHDDPNSKQSGDPWSCIASPAIFDFFAPYR